MDHDSATSPGHCDEALSWLSSQQTLETRVQDDHVTIWCPEPKFEAEITDTPVACRLTVVCQRRFTLRIAPEIKIGDDFTLCLVADDTTPTLCEIEVDVPNIICSTVEAVAGQEWPRLALWDNTHVEVTGGNWHIEARPGRDITATSLAAVNREQSLRIRIDPPVSSLDSTGDHEFDLRFPEGATATVHEGTATFHRALHSASVTGPGSVKALSNVTDCSVDLSGDLEVHGEIRHCDISLGGDLEVNGQAAFGESTLRCRDALFNGPLDTSGVMKCRALDVRGEIRGAAELTLTSLKCAGTATAKEVTAAEEITIGGDVNCGLLHGEGSIDVRGNASKIRQLRWKPARGGSELAFHRARMVIPSITVEDGGLNGEIPALRLSNETHVAKCLIDVPCLAILISDDAGAQRDQAQAEVNMGFARAAAEIKLKRGQLGLQLTDRVENFKLHVAGSTKTHLSGTPSDISELAIRGDGDVIFDGQGSTSPLHKVKIVGRTAFSCSNDIDDLATSAWTEGTPEADGSEDNRPPRLILDSGVVVRRAAGTCRLDHLDARIYGDARQPLTVTSISSRGVTEGHLTNVDVSKLPDGQIHLLRHLRVLEVSDSALKRFASERTSFRCNAQAIRNVLWRARRREHKTDGREPLTTDAIRSRAETAAQLAEILGGKVNSGSSRARLFWAVARLQHRGLNNTAPEKAFRAAYRLVGYGYRPLPALLTWAAVALLGLLYAWTGTYAGEPAEIAFGWQWIERYIEFLFMPISYLRFGSNGATQLFERTAVDIVSRLLVGLPFLFTILSIRQYFRSPVGQRGHSNSSDS